MSKSTDFRPFEDKEKVKQLEKERDDLIETLNNFEIPETEKMFIVKRIKYVTEKLLEKARYGK